MTDTWLVCTTGDTDTTKKMRHGTLEYWRMILNEAGLDADSIEHLVCERLK